MEAQASVGGWIQWNESELWDDGELVAKRGFVGHIVGEELQPDGTKTWNVFFERTNRVSICFDGEFHVLGDAETGKH